MAHDVHVIEDGVNSAPNKRPSHPSWVLGVVGFALGLGLGVVVVGSTDGTMEASPTTIPVEETAAETTVVTDETAPTPGVVGVIPEFPDAIVAVAGTTGSSFQHLLWPLKGDLTVRSMDGGSDVAIDSSAIFFALSDEVPGLPGRLLSMGRFNAIRPVSAEVTSYVFHDSENGALGYTALSNGGVQLYNVKANLVTDEVAALGSPDAAVRAWGDWGWAIQDGDQILLLTAAGEVKDTERGTALASHPTGWVFAVEGNEVKLVSAGGGVSRLPSALDVGSVRSAAFSPDRERVAVGGERGLAVVSVDEGTIETLADTAVSHVAWSSDSRFVLVGSSFGVVVHDLQTGESYPIFRNYNAVVAGVVPLRSS